MSKTISFIIFFSIVLVVYGSINFYVYIRTLKIVPPSSSFRILFIILFWFLASSYLLARLLEKYLVSWLVSSFIWIGSLWLAVIVYVFLFLLVVDVLKFLNHLFHFSPQMLFSDPYLLARCVFLPGFLLVLIVIIMGRLNAISPRVVNLELEIEKKASISELNIVALSDLHLGTLVCNDHFLRIVKMVNSLNPDIVLLVGDIVDEDIQPVIEQNLGETLRLISSKYGVYGVTGNHEFFGGVDKACKYLEEHGVNMLRDETVKVANSFVILGRDDITIQRFEGKRRKSIKELINVTDLTLPKILLDHQPLNLSEVAENDIDLALFGHTHYGQLWPFNLIASMIYEVSWGYKRKGNTHIYVSCGIGTWGPPIRTSSRPELLNIKLKLKGPSER